MPAWLALPCWLSRWPCSREQGPQGELVLQYVINRGAVGKPAITVPIYVANVHRQQWRYHVNATSLNEGFWKRVATLR